MSILSFLPPREKRQMEPWFLVAAMSVLLTAPMRVRLIAVLGMRLTGS
jgi:hypothetical protein